MVRRASLAALVALTTAAMLAIGGCAAPTRDGAQRLQRLERLSSFVDRATAPGGYLGAVTLVMHDGRIVEHRAHGHADLARTRAMRPDAIFRIYSMSKTVIGVAAMMLVEEGRLSLTDPVARHLPGFAAVQVMAGGSADAPLLRAPTRPPTVHDLLRHTAGLATGGAGIEAASALMERADPHGASDLAGFASRVATVPLADDPGTTFRYDGVGIEVLGRVIEVAAGEPLADFLQRRVFDPLGMVDTGFEVPPAQRHRVVDLTSMGPDGRLVLADEPSAANPGTRLRRYDSGAGGLYSTAPDVAKLASMLLAGGSARGVTLLGRKTVESMTSNHLAALPPQQGLPRGQWTAGEGFGIGGSVLVDPAARGRLGSVGAYGWSGAASTWYTIDFSERLVAILLLQHLPGGGQADLPRLSLPFANLVYQSLPPASTSTP